MIKIDNDRRFKNKNLVAEHSVVLFKNYKMSNDKKDIDLGSYRSLIKQFSTSYKHQYKLTLSELAIKLHEESPLISPVEVKPVLNNSRSDFSSSSLIMIDVDDENSELDLEEFFRLSKASLLFYTVSHGTNGNRFRLCYQLDTAINNEARYLNVHAYMVSFVKSLLIDTTVKVDKTTDILGIYRVGVNKPKCMIDESKFLDLNFILKDMEMQVLSINKAVKELTDYILEVKDSRNDVFDKINCIGYISSGHSLRSEWLQVLTYIKAMLHYNIIDVEDSKELFDIVSGGETNYEDVFENIKFNGFIPFGKVNKLAKERGGYVLDATLYGKDDNKKNSLNFNEEILNYDTYLTKNDFYNAINKYDVVLFDSATGSGKTTAVIELQKEIIETNEDTVCLFGLPSLNTISQLSEIYGVEVFTGTRFKDYQDKEKTEEIEKVLDNEKFLLCTYEYLSKAIQYNYLKGNKIVVVIDEVHKINLDLNFKDVSINNLMENIELANKVVSLTGTTHLIDKDKYDIVIKCVPNNKREIIKENVVVYDLGEKGDLVKILPKLIKGKIKKYSPHNTNDSVLVFIQNKKLIEKIALKLLELGLSKEDIIIISSDTELNEDILKGNFQKGKVILSTSIISEGYSLFNESVNYEVIVVISDKKQSSSRFYDVDVVLQMANRLRNPYNYFSIITQLGTDLNDYKYNFNSAVTHYKNNATNILKVLNSRIENKEFYMKGIVEDNYFIKLVNGNFQIDIYRLEEKARRNYNTYNKLNKRKYIDSIVENLNKINKKQLQVVITDIYEAYVKNFGEDVELTVNEENVSNEKIEDLQYNYLCHTLDFASLGYLKKEERNKEENDDLIYDLKDCIGLFYYNVIINYIDIIDDAEILKKVVINIKNKNSTQKIKKDVYKLIYGGYYSSLIDGKDNTVTVDIINTIFKVYDKYKVDKEVKETGKVFNGYLNIDWDLFLMEVNVNLKNDDINITEDLLMMIIEDVLRRKRLRVRDGKSNKTVYNVDVYKIDEMVEDYKYLTKEEIDYVAKRYMKVVLGDSIINGDVFKMINNSLSKCS